MFRKGSLLCLLTALSVALPLSAQPKKEAKKEEKKKDPKKGAPVEPEMEPGAAKPADAPQDDVVVDNRDLEKRKAMEAQLKEAENPTFENDTPFATGAPDPVALREQRWKPGLGGGFRMGFAFPMGDYSKQGKLADAADGLIFLGGEFGYWAIPEFFFGLGVSGGYVIPDCSSDEDVSCAGWQLRGGPLVMLRFQPFQSMSPFVGVGTGYEWLTRSASTDSASARETAHGFEYVNFQAGLDVKSRGDFYGVFVSYSLAKYTKESSSFESDTVNREDSGDITDPRMHSWLGIGARGTLE